MEETDYVTPDEADAEVARLKGGMVRHLERAARRGRGRLKGRARHHLIVGGPDGNPVRVAAAAVKGGRLVVSGFFVEDPEDQAVDGEKTELDAEALSELGVEALASVVRYFAG